MNTPKSLPFSNESEQAVLSYILNNQDKGLSDEIQKDFFYVPAHREVYSAFLALSKDGSAVDLVMLTQKMINDKTIDKIGGPAYLNEILFLTVHNFEWHLNEIKNKAKLRELISKSSEIIEDCYSNPNNVDSVFDKAEEQILSIRKKESTTGVENIKSIVSSVLDEIEECVANPGLIKGIKTGFSKLDAITQGLKGSELYVIAARPSVGKTAFMMNLVDNIAIDQKIPTGVFSLEMSSKMLVQRLLSSNSRVAINEIKKGVYNQGQINAISRSTLEIGDSPIFIDDTHALTIDSVKARARRLKSEHGIGLIAIDYLQLIRGSDKLHREREIAEVSNGLKGIAKELNIPVIALAQLNRDVDKRKGGRPILADLRESGSIEQDGDIIAFLTREDYAGSKTILEEEEEKTGKGSLIIAKNRNGETGDIPLQFIPEQVRFTEAIF